MIGVTDKAIDLLLDRCITRSRFRSLVLQGGMVGGVPIGQGKCKGVILSANHFELYETTEQFTGNNGGFYYGDSQQQSKQYLVNTNETPTDTNARDTGIIPCEDQSEVWVRCDAPNSVLVSGAGTAAVNGLYTFRGSNNGFPFYNLVGQGTDSSLYSVVVFNDGPDLFWYINDTDNQYKSVETVENYHSVFDVNWEVVFGAEPVPTVTASPITIQIEIQVLD